MEKQILIAYCSWHGNTAKIAEQIEAVIGGTLFEIKPVQPYSTDYNATVNQAREEISKGIHPEVEELPDISQFSTVLVGTPIWCGTMAPPLATFIASSDFANKTIVPFYTHGGGGGGRYEADVAALAPQATVTKSLDIVNSGDADTKNQISAWLGSIGIDF